MDTPLDAQLSPLLFGIFKSAFSYGKFVFILVLSSRPVYGKGALAWGQFQLA